MTMAGFERTCFGPFADGIY